MLTKINRSVSQFDDRFATRVNYLHNVALYIQVCSALRGTLYELNFVRLYIRQIDYGLFMSGAIEAALDNVELIYNLRIQRNRSRTYGTIGEKLAQNCRIAR